jgi:hypothetical protein
MTSPHTYTRPNTPQTCNSTSSDDQRKRPAGCDKLWDEATYDSIDWRHHGEAFKKLSIGRRTQISKYTNDLLPTRRHLQTIDTCQNLWEDTTHVLTCSCRACTTARTQARASFQQKLSCMHTLNIMNKIICASMDSWLDQRPVVAPLRTGPEEPIQCQLRSAFHAQCQIGWDQFFRGHMAKAWILPIGTY